MKSRKTKLIAQWHRFSREQKGQSIIIITFAVVALMAFTALAVDIGIIWITKSQLMNACDAAALASVVEMPDQDAARDTAIEYLRLHNIEDDDVHDIILSYPESVFDNKIRVQVSKQCTLFFAPIIGREYATVWGDAEAEYVSYLPMTGFSTREEYGAVGLVNYSVFGYHTQRQWGDPYSAYYEGSGYGDLNPWYDDDGYDYSFDVTEDWVAAYGNLVQVDIFDPDSYNKYDVPGDDDPNPSTPDTRCGGSVNHNWTNPWVEGEPTGPKTPIRVDEMHEAHGKRYSDGTAFTKTRYSIYSPAGVEVAHAEYAGAYRSVANDAVYANTDLHWVTPAEYAATDGTYHCPACSFYGDFLFDVSTYGTGTYIVRVSAVSGSAGQYYNLRVGPPHHSRQPVLDTTPWGVSDESKLFIFGNGRLTINFNTPYRSNCAVPIEVTLGWVPAEAEDGWVYVDKFDTDIGFESLEYKLFYDPGDGVFVEYTDAEWPWTGTRAYNDTWTSGGEPDRVHIPVGWPPGGGEGGYLRAAYSAANTDTSCWKMWFEGVIPGHGKVIRLTK